MSAQHKRPLLAFLLVVVLCIILLGQAVRSEALLGLLSAPTENRSAPSRSGCPPRSATGSWRTRRGCGPPAHRKARPSHRTSSSRRHRHRDQLIASPGTSAPSTAAASWPASRSTTARKPLRRARRVCWIPPGRRGRPSGSTPGHAKPAHGHANGHAKKADPAEPRRGRGHRGDRSGGGPRAVDGPGPPEREGAEGWFGVRASPRGPGAAGATSGRGAQQPLEGRPPKARALLRPAGGHRRQLGVHPQHLERVIDREAQVAGDLAGLAQVVGGELGGPDRSGSGPVISTRDSSARIETLASDLAPRMPISAAATASRTAGSAAAADPQPVDRRPGAWWIDPSCHHDQTSSVT